MKERFEELSVWREKQKEEREFLEGRLEEAKQRILSLTTENEGLKNQIQELQSISQPGQVSI